MVNEEKMGECRQRGAVFIPLLSFCFVHSGNVVVNGNGLWGRGVRSGSYATRGVAGGEHV